MACGVPVIASNVGGLPELITHNVSGYLFPMGEYDAMGDAAETLLRDKEVHKRLGVGARERAEQFSQSKIIDRYENLYRRVLKTD
jgi:glycosyltransferase involved in cell wall biosynthesis